MAKITEVDANTGIVEIRDATAAELAAFKSAETINFAEIIAAKAAARESRKAKLLALGLTEDELEA